MKFSIASISHTGKVREVNQDRVFAATDTRAGLRCALLVVADGMGGLTHGEMASTLAVQLLSEWWATAEPMDLQRISQQIDDVIYEIHRRIYDLAEQIHGQTGSTLSLMYFLEDSYLTKQIGDSRIYCLENGQAQQITVDQTWCNRAIASGALTPEQAANHRLSHALVNALGASAELEIDTRYGMARKGTGYLLCSDGFYHEAPLDAAAAQLRKAPDVVLQGLLGAVLQGEATDNASAVLCYLK